MNSIEWMNNCVIKANKALAEAVKDRREQLGFGRQYVSSHVYLENRTIYNVESMQHGGPRFPTLVKICEALQIIISIGPGGMVICHELPYQKPRRRHIRRRRWQVRNVGVNDSTVEEEQALEVAQDFDN